MTAPIAELSIIVEEEVLTAHVGRDRPVLRA